MTASDQPPALIAGEGSGAIKRPPLNASEPASGLACLCMVAAHHRKSVDPLQLARALGFEQNKTLGVADVLLATKEIGLKAKAVPSAWNRLPKLSMPAIACLTGEQFVVVLAYDGAKDKIVIADPARRKQSALDQAAFEAVWSGQLILIKTPLRLDNPSRPFDLFWFVPAIFKYRKVLGEVVLAALFIQLLSLGTPMFTQVIIDKVLTHKSSATLHVLAAGMLIMIAFEGILALLKTHLMSHTSNRIDVALGARLFRHLLHLPLRSFETRRVGDTVARVRELDNIRQFLTGSSVTLLLDLLFLLPFITVLFF